MKKIMYLFEYFCSPIWLYETPNDMSRVKNVNVDVLPISQDLKNEIRALDFIYQSTYNDDYPAEPIKLSKEEELNFCKRVIESEKKLYDELVSKYKIVFDKDMWKRKIDELENC
ncbi:hypothetical protein [Flagellimonas baculiformis]|uniref:hypothetical protein n=1 Tax=Flagellimonas baculiformis TaxID=3067310 RepID=UPI00296FAD48|nr:hypothetical protein [Muricauda sp. D6]